MRSVPWSGVMCSGTSKQLIHHDRGTDAHNKEDTFDIRTVLNQQVNLLMIVKRYRGSSKGGRKSRTVPTATLMASVERKREESGVGKLCFLADARDFLNEMKASSCCSSHRRDFGLPDKEE